MEQSRYGTRMVTKHLLIAKCTEFGVHEQTSALFYRQKKDVLSHSKEV